MAIFGDLKPSSPLSSTYAGFPSDMDDWSCGQWMEYYTRNKSALGQEQAKSIINTDAGATSAFSDSQWCKYDCNFVEFFSKEGLDTGNVFSKAYCAIENTADAVSSVSTSVKNVTGTVSNLTKSPWIVIGGLAGVGYLATKLFPEFFKIKK